jgi:hypothetical protein
LQSVPATAYTTRQKNFQEETNIMADQDDMQKGGFPQNQTAGQDTYSTTGDGHPPRPGEQGRTEEGMAGQGTGQTDDSEETGTSTGITGGSTSGMDTGNSIMGGSGSSSDVGGSGIGLGGGMGDNTTGSGGMGGGGGAGGVGSSGGAGGTGSSSI